MSGSTGSTTHGQPTFTNVYNAHFSVSGIGGCFGCHGGLANPALNGNFAMMSDQATTYKALVSAMSSQRERVQGYDPCHTGRSHEAPALSEVVQHADLPDADAAGYPTVRGDRQHDQRLDHGWRAGRLIVGRQRAGAGVPGLHAEQQPSTRKDCAAYTLQPCFTGRPTF
jgi:hypothetical protein